MASQPSASNDFTRREWQAFLQASTNGTLFHDLDFLAYHPLGRYNFHHLVFRRDGELVALLPGALVDGGFHSTSGASIGGLVLTGDADMHSAGEMIEALQRHAAERGWNSIAITLPPSAIYSPDLGDAVGIALRQRGFTLDYYWYCPILDLRTSASFEQHYQRRLRDYVRAGRRNGMTLVSGGVELMSDFLPLFRSTYERHGCSATHSEAEIADLLSRLPDRVRLYLAMKGEAPAAGLIVFRLSQHVATTFYICSERTNDRGPAIAIAELMEALAADGVRFLDLGPSASSRHLNRGTLAFKERLGARGWLRNRWTWQT